MPLKLKDETWVIIPIAPGKWKVSVKGLPSEVVDENYLKVIFKSRGLSDSEIQEILDESLMDGEIRAKLEEGQGLTSYLAKKVSMALRLLAPLVALGDWRVMNAINILQSKLEKVLGEDKETQQFYSVPEIIKALQAFKSTSITKKQIDFLLLRLF